MVHLLVNVVSKNWNLLLNILLPGRDERRPNRALLLVTGSRRIRWEG